jgi:hypothetical protein
LCSLGRQFEPQVVTRVPQLAEFARNLPLWTEAIILWDAKTTHLCGDHHPQRVLYQPAGVRDGYTPRNNAQVVEGGEHIMRTGLQRCRSSEWEDGMSEHVPFRLALVRSLDLLDLIPQVHGTADVYMRRKLMPSNPPSDALHLALASHYNCDVLVTWNYHHLANTNKLKHIRVVNAELGLPVPSITTPRQLLGGRDDRI